MKTLTWLEPTFDWVWQSSWQASVLVALVLLALWLCGTKLTPKWRCGLWLLVAARLLLPAAPTTSLSVFNWVRVAPVADAIPAFAPWEMRAGSAEIEIPPALPPTGRAAAPIVEPRASSPIALTTITPRPTLSLKAILGQIWLIGAVLFGALLTWQYWRFRLRLTDSVRVEDAATLHLLREVSEALGLKWSPTVLATDHVSSPALFGFWRIRLLLPTGMTAALSPRELRHVFLHEAAHLRRGDMALNWLTTALQVLHWFNPILWFGFARLRAERELACDALALTHAHAGEARNYAQTIIKLLEGCSPPQSLPGLVGILEDNNHMKRRIAMITKFKSVRRWPVLALCLVAGLGVVALTDAQVERAGKAAPEAAKTKMVAATVSNPGQGDSAKPELTSPVGMTLRRLGPPKYPYLYNNHKVSPDGRYIGIGWECELALVENPSQIIRKLAKSGRGLSFSGDSTRVALVEGKELRTMALDGSGSKTVFRDDNLKDFSLYAWSGDGRWFAVSMARESRTYELAVIDSADGTIRRLKSTGANEMDRAEFSPDSRYLVYDIKVDKDGSNADIFVIDLEGGQEIPLVVHPADDRLFGWNPSSNTIVFSSNRRGSYDAWAIPFADGKAQGSPLLVKADLGNANPLGFTKSGALYFGLTIVTEDVFSLQIDPQTGKPQGTPVIAVERFEGANSASDWSSDGRYLAYSSKRSPYVLCILDTQTQRERIVSEGMFGPKWSPDGRSILAFSSWDSREGNLYKVDVATGGRSLLVESKPDRGLNRSYCWSPDGRSVYYQYGTGKGTSPIVRLDIATGTELEIHRVEGGAFFAVSPDGESIVFKMGPGRGSNIHLIPAKGGQPKLLAQFPGYFIPGWDAFTWSADGRAIIVCKWQTDRTVKVGDTVKSEMVRVPIDGGDPETILVMPRVRYPNPHPDGSRITFTASKPRSELWVMEGFLPGDRIGSNP